MNMVAVLCLNAEDLTRMVPLVRALERIGLKCRQLLLTDFSSEGGVHPRLQEVISRARYVVLGLSAGPSGATVRSVDRQLELLAPAALLRPVDRPFLVPVRLEFCEVPPSLGHLQHVDLFDPSGVNRLAKHLEEDLLLFTDPRDGQTYPTVKIGTRTWLARNLDYDLDAQSGSWPVASPPSDVPWGRLYTLEGARTACPKGWHLPSDGEWRELAIECGGYKDMDQGYPRTGISVGRPEQAFDVLARGGSTGFDAQFAGVRTAEGAFNERARTGVYWSSTGFEYSTMLNYASVLVQSAWVYVFYTLSGQVELRRDYELPIAASGAPLTKYWGLSVRCVQDN